MLSQALRYAGAGINVFPVNGKVPLTEHGFHDATTDRQQIKAWWTTHPNAGIATPDFDAVDVDLYKPECSPTWETIRPLIPERTPQNRTGRGGLQFLFQPGTLKNGKIGPGVDSRYAGSNYIVLPPSRHHLSDDRYEVILDVLTTRPPPAPDFPHVSGNTTEFRHLLDEMNAGKKIASDRNKAAWWRAVEILRTLPPGSDLEPVKALVQSWVDANCEGDLSEVDVTKQVNGAATFVATERADQKDTRRQPALTDLGNAELFARRNAHQLRHVRERRQWLAYGDVRWRPDVTGEAERAAKEVARERLRGAVDITDDDKQRRHVAWAMTSQSGPRLREMLTVASTEPTIVLAAEELDTDPFLLSCANGTLISAPGRYGRRILMT